MYRYREQVKTSAKSKASYIKGSAVVEFILNNARYLTLTKNMRQDIMGEDGRVLNEMLTELAEKGTLGKRHLK